MIEKKSLISTILVSVTIMIALAISGELVAREYREQIPLDPHRGTSHAMFEIKYRTLQDFDQAVGGVDCIFIGSSMTYRGIDPDSFERAYFAQTGEEIECFNFGLNGVSAAEEGIIATILMEEFKPSLLIWGVSPRDFSIGVGEDAAESLTATSWVGYRMGQPSLGGWLSENSLAFQYYNALRAYNDPAVWAELERRENEITADGYVLNPEISGEGIPAVNRETLPSADRSLLDFIFEEDDLEAIGIFADFQSEEVRVVIIEMPVPPTYYQLFDGGEAGYQSVMIRIGKRAASDELYFLRTMSHNLIPDEGWLNHDHTNHIGAVALSEWLGDLLGQGASQ